MKPNNSIGQQPKDTQLSIMDRIKGYNDACTHLERSPLTLEQFSFLPENQQVSMFSLHQIITVIEALNEGQEFDWNNYEEYKYYPWFDMETYGDAPAGSGFSFGGFGCDGAYAAVGSRLCLRSAEHAKYVGNLMLEQYKAWMK